MRVHKYPKIECVQTAAILVWGLSLLAFLRNSKFLIGLNWLVQTAIHKHKNILVAWMNAENMYVEGVPKQLNHTFSSSSLT